MHMARDGGDTTVSMPLRILIAEAELISDSPYIARDNGSDTCHDIEWMLSFWLLLITYVIKRII